MDYSKALVKQLSKSNGRKIVLISEGVLGTYLMQAFAGMKKNVDKYIDIRKCGGGGI